MGGKSSKAKPAKANKKAKKSKGRKSKSLDDLSAPEGKYETQSTLPRPDINLEGAQANLANGAKVEVTADGDVSIPNADIDLEDTANKLDSTANHTGNNISSSITEQSGRLSKSLDTGLDQAEDIAIDFQTSAQNAANDAAEHVNEVSQNVEQKSQELSENVESSAEKAVEVSENARNSVQDVTANVSEDVEKVSSDFSRNVDERVDETVTSAEETLEKASSDAENGLDSTLKQGNNVLENVEDNVEQTTDDVAKEVEQDVDKAQAVSVDLQNSVDARLDDVNRNSENISSDVHEKAEQVALEVDTGVADVHETSLVAEDSLKESADELERTSGSFSAEFEGNKVVELDSQTEGVEEFAQDAQNSVDETADEVNRISANFAVDVAENTDEVAPNVEDELKVADEMSAGTTASVAFAAADADVVRNTGESVEENANEFAQKVEEKFEDTTEASVEVENSVASESQNSEVITISGNIGPSVVESTNEMSEGSVKGEETSPHISQEDKEADKSSPPESPGRGSVAARIADFNRLSGSKLVTKKIAKNVKSSPERIEERSHTEHKTAQPEIIIVEQNSEEVSSAVPPHIETVTDDPDWKGLEVKVNGDVDSTVQSEGAVVNEVEQLVQNGNMDLSETENVDIDSNVDVDVVGSPISPTYEEESDAVFVTAYNDFRNESLKDFLARSKTIGGDVGEIADLVRSAFESQKDFLVMASRSQEPAPDKLQGLLKPQSEKITATVEFREQKRKSPHFNHLSAVSEGIAALGWVAVTPTPGPYVKDAKESSLFYNNKVLKEAKEKQDENQVEWARSLTKIFDELMAYIKQYHTTGVTWNAQGSVAALPTPSAGGAPPPPPPPPPAPEPSDVSVSSGGPDPRAALFSELNKGEDVTKGLKKVTDDMKTHKNPLLRKGPAPFKVTKVSSSPVAAPKQPKSAPPPKLELVADKKWLVEHHVNNQNIVIDRTEMKHLVYVYKCDNSTVQVKGKVNSVIVDSCKKVGIVVEDVISCVEFVNCQSVKGQILGTAPTVSIDKTDGCMIYLSEKSLDTNIVTAKSSEMNIALPTAEGDLTEFPVPEQFKTTWNGKAFVTETLDLNL